MAEVRRVYVVDDDTAVRSSIVFALGTLGFQARPVSSGRMFIDDMGSFAPGCVLLDVRMPEIDGLQVIEAMGSSIHELPVVIMTGHGDIATAVRAMKLGASDFIEKPFDEAVLLVILDGIFATLSAKIGDVGQVMTACTRLEALAPREAEVLKALAAGHANKMIAHHLQISVRTVEMYRARMMHRLGVRSLSEALRLAFLAGWTSTADDSKSAAAI